MGEGTGANRNGILQNTLLELIKGTLLQRLNFSCAWRRLNEHDPH